MQTIRFLLVEDDPSAAITAQIALEEGWEKRGIKADVAVCPDGLAAIAHLEKAAELPNIIITDIKMPKLDGNRLIGILKGTSFYKHIPIIVLSTSDDPKDIERAFLGQCAGYILKSPDYDRFAADLELVQRYWELSRLPHEPG